jgi:ribosomal protein S18 acetylase RimI-like enzyme
MKININLATRGDLDNLLRYEKHIKTEMIMTKIESKMILTAYIDNEFIGYLRYGMFWDEHPFMNLLFIIPELRRKNYGKKLVNYWEDMMCEEGYNFVMTSTLSNEDAQHFFRSIGYKEIGGFILNNEPMEMIMTKQIVNNC